ncbi:hypothetical protein [Oceanospirillum sediminis]|uniref:Uncharacterized protein n=1 Tax=Oceanospirillum sediminis TaxID=2760088 RepID=A0A839IRX7_9GAMM|nr:hypothetical protein [Oceanospirillum sediminis]MBB1487718.1 hypothetical protein [Oceanospirillum sediminis]
MSSSSEKMSGVDQYLAKVQKLSDAQQQKVAELIDKTQQDLDTWQPSMPEHQQPLDEQMDALYQNVNQELEKAMDLLSKQIKSLS